MPVHFVPEDASAAAAAPSLVVGAQPVSLWAGKGNSRFSTTRHHLVALFTRRRGKIHQVRKGVAPTRRPNATAKHGQPKSECNRKQATGQLFLTENYRNCQLERASCKHSATLERHRLFRNNSLIKKSCETITPGCCIK